jgi:hypothetical protein
MAKKHQFDYFELLWLMQQVRASICHPTGLPVFFIFVPDRDRELGAKKLRL